MSRLIRKSSVPGLLSLAALLFLVVPSMADDKPAPSYNETATVLATIDKHGHFYQVATDSKIYLFMCTKVKTFQLGAPDCKVGDKPIAKGDTVHFRIDSDWAYMAPVSEGIEERLRILATELKTIPPLPAAPPADTDKKSKTTAESGVVIGTGMHIRGQHGSSWSTIPTGVGSPITTASAGTPVIPTGPVLATPVTGGAPVVVSPVGPTSGGVITGVPVTGGAPITAIPTGPVTGIPVGGAPGSGGMQMGGGGGAPPWVHILRIQTAGKIYQLECSKKPCRAANKEIALGDALSFRVDKKWAYLSGGMQGSGTGNAEEEKYRILGVTEAGSPSASKAP